MKLIREIKPDLKVSDSSLFAELVKDKNKRELVLKNLAIMEKKKQDLDVSQCEDIANKQNMVTPAPSNGMCVTDIIKEIPLPPPIPSSFSSFLSSTALPKSESEISSNRPMAVIDLTESENLRKKPKGSLVNDAPECLGSSITSNKREEPILPLG